MRRDWMKVGERELRGGRVVVDDETPVRASKKTVVRAIKSMPWEPLSDGLSVGMMPGLGIKAAIKELRIPRVTAIGISNELAPYGFYGIAGTYKNGRVCVYLLDTGTTIVPLCADLYEDNGEALAKLKAELAREAAAVAAFDAAGA